MLLPGGSVGWLYPASWGLSGGRSGRPRLIHPPAPHPPPRPGCLLRALCPQGPGAAGCRSAECRCLHPGPEHCGEPEGAEAAAPGGRQGLHGECEVSCVWRVSGPSVVWGLGSGRALERRACGTVGPVAEAGPSGVRDEGGAQAGGRGPGLTAGTPRSTSCGAGRQPRPPFEGPGGAGAPVSAAC